MIFKLKPTYKDYLWGGHKLKKNWGKETTISPLAESWEISCHKDGQSLIMSGPYKGQFLSEVIEQFNENSQLDNGLNKCFPFMVKFIDAKLDLSIQVHPDDDYGYRVEQEPGKTEVWYVLDAEPSSELIMGFERQTSKEEIRRAIDEGWIMDLLHKEPVKKRDVFFIESGTVHGIGAGITLIEIQQNSNTTYRVYDYDRIDKNGKKRDLHLDKALEVMDYNSVSKREWNHPVIASCDYFHSEIHVFQDTRFEYVCTNYCGVTCIDGQVIVSQDEETLFLETGDSAFVIGHQVTYDLSGTGNVILTMPATKDEKRFTEKCDEFQ